MKITEINLLIIFIQFLYLLKISLFPQSRKLILKHDGRIHEIKIKKELVDKMLECLHNREVDLQDKSSSASMRRTRRSDYSNSDDLRSNLQQLETNLVLQLTEKLDDIVTLVNNLNSRITSLEDQVAKKEKDVDNPKVDEDESKNNNNKVGPSVIINADDDSNKS